MQGVVMVVMELVLVMVRVILVFPEVLDMLGQQMQEQQEMLGV
jgi:hypothetical protein